MEKDASVDSASAPEASLVQSSNKSTTADITDESSLQYKRKIYRLQQEEKRKVLKTARFEETDKDEKAKLPKKKYYRQRAHSNPFSDHQLE